MNPDRFFYCLQEVIWRNTNTTLNKEMEITIKPKTIVMLFLTVLYGQIVNGIRPWISF